jgi:hypothetical protein
MLVKDNTESGVASVIEKTCNRAAGEQAQRFEQLFADCSAQKPDTTEAMMLSGFVPLLGMSLARLPQDLQRGYTLRFTQRVNEICGKDSGTRFPHRVLEYLSAFQQDVISGDGNSLPALLSAAVAHVCGVSGETAASCRASLLQVLIQALRADVERFGGIRLVTD